MRGRTALVTLAAVVVALATDQFARASARQGIPSAGDSTSQTVSAPRCSPVDSAWGISVHVTDAVTGKPVAGVYTTGESMSATALTDSSGWACVRTLADSAQTLDLSRPGYRESAIIVARVPHRIVHREVLFQRVPPPCCELRGRWKISFRLSFLGDLNREPTARTVTGEVDLGPRYMRGERGDDLDSLVHVVRGLHHVDFTPFFGGPVARDVSTTVFGGGPDLLHEVEASIPAADSVEITFIPRMSHGSLSLVGRIRGNAILGFWRQNAFGTGASGRFLMTRLGPPDTTATVPDSAPGDTRRPRERATTVPALRVPPGMAPTGRWRPQLAIAPDGRLWLAVGGLYVADSLTSGWHRVLGGETDPVEGDELRIGLVMAFVGSRGAIIGMGTRYPMAAAPVIYRTDDAGASWSAALTNVREVGAAGAVGPSVWMTFRREGVAGVELARSQDGGKTWVESTLPEPMGHVNLMYRASAMTAYVATDGDGQAPSLWRTSDGGNQWTPLAAPHDQGLQRLGSSDTRVEQIATAGRWLLVREHGRVFATPTSSMRWRELPGIHDIASERGFDEVFILSDSLRPALLDGALHVVWRSARPLPIKEPRDVEQVLFHAGAGYVSETSGAVHEVRREKSLVVRPDESLR